MVNDIPMQQKSMNALAISSFSKNDEEAVVGGVVITRVIRRSPAISENRRYKKMVRDSFKLIS
jgi:hypothetical protein